MKKGEKAIWGMAALITGAALFMGYTVYHAPPRVMPTYQLESVEASRGELVYRQNSCSSCHKIWTLGGSKGGVLDGIGSRRDADWMNRYLAAEEPQQILPSTQKKIYQMPSFAYMSEKDRTDLVSFLQSLKEYEPEEGPS